MRHYKQIQLRKGKSRVFYHPGADARFGANEEGVDIAVSEDGHYFQVIPFTYTDLLRLQRVVRRGLKRLKK